MKKKRREEREERGDLLSLFDVFFRCEKSEESRPSLSRLRVFHLLLLFERLSSPTTSPPLSTSSSSLSLSSTRNRDAPRSPARRPPPRLLCCGAPLDSSRSLVGEASRRRRPSFEDEEGRAKFPCLLSPRSDKRLRLRVSFFPFAFILLLRRRGRGLRCLHHARRGSRRGEFKREREREREGKERSHLHQLVAFDLFFSTSTLSHPTDALFSFLSLFPPSKKKTIR